MLKSAVYYSKAGSSPNSPRCPEWSSSSATSCWRLCCLWWRGRGRRWWGRLLDLPLLWRRHHTQTRRLHQSPSPQLSSVVLHKERRQEWSYRWTTVKENKQLAFVLHVVHEKWQGHSPPFLCSTFGRTLATSTALSAFSVSALCCLFFKFSFTRFWETQK